MKTYFINKIENKDVNVTANSLKELAVAVIKEANYLRRVYVHCLHVCTTNKQGDCFDEQNVEYIVDVNNSKGQITTKRLHR